MTTKYGAILCSLTSAVQCGRFNWRAAGGKTTSE